MDPKVAVVILNYNTCSLLQEFIPFALQTDYANFELIVADNASDDNSVSWLRENHPGVRCIELPKNLGYADGYNQALEQVNADYYVLLNSDVEVHPKWLQTLVSQMENDRNIAACQPKILWYSMRESFEYAGAAGGYIDKYGYPFCRGRIFNVLEKDMAQYDSPADIFWASGACLMIRKRVWEEVGGLDPDFFAHMEEIDLCWRIKTAGYRIVCAPGSIIYHMGGGTLSQQSSRKTYLNFRNGLVLLLKNLPSDRIRSVLFRRVLMDYIAAARFLSIGKFSDFRAVFKAHLHFFRNYRFWYKKRHSSHPENLELQGIYQRSIVLDHFLRGKKFFSDLSWK